MKCSTLFPGVLLAAAMSLLPTVPLFSMNEAGAEIRTPAESPAPKINGPSVFGVRPGSPFLYTIPATGERPMRFSAENLPTGLRLDPETGIISGNLSAQGEYKVVLAAENARGKSSRPFRIVCGDKIALTPPMGWNSYNCWGQKIDQDKVIRSARALKAAGLDRHGWTYVNIDDGWQGERGGPFFAIQPNAGFGDMKALADTIHGMGLKIGIYSSPWITTYGGFRGGSSDSADGAWTYVKPYECNKRLGKYSFIANDAKQFGAWGIDYLKYDWLPEEENTKAMAQALRATGRDIILSLSAGTSPDNAAGVARWAQSWRTTGDIWDPWETPGPWQYSVSAIAFSQDGWTNLAGPGHWNDPDMLVVGVVGWNDEHHQTLLTPAEQYTHITMWCMLSAPLLIGCDLEKLDAFTLNLLTNDEVIAIDQDALGRQAKRVATSGAIDIYLKHLEDGSVALAFFNRGDTVHTAKAIFKRLGVATTETARDLWKQKDLGTFKDKFEASVAPHDVLLVRLTSVDVAK